MVKLLRQLQEEKFMKRSIDKTISLCSHHKLCTGAPKGICPHCGEKKSVANMARRRKSCALKNERQYTLKEEEIAAQRKIRENENKGIMIKCEHCDEPKSKTNISRHKRACKRTKDNVGRVNRTANS